MRQTLALSAIALAGALFAAAPAGQAAAETASDLRCKGCVGKREIGKKAIRRKHISGKAVNAGKLANDSKPAGAGVKERIGETVRFRRSSKTVAKVTVEAPAAGLVVVLANGYWDFVGDKTLAGCSITTGNRYDEPQAIVGFGSNADESRIRTMSTSRVFPVSRGKDTYKLICRTSERTAVEIQNPKLTAIYVPQNY